MRLFERLFGVRVVRDRTVALVFERVHLRRFFDSFEVDCVFDVGANRGQYATMLREDVGYKGPIISFEPIPKLARRLGSPSRRWYVENVAIDREAGERQFYVMETDCFSSLHKPSVDEVGEQFVGKNEVREAITVKTSPLQPMYDKYKAMLGFKRPFLKLDTQGHDLAIAQSAGSLLANFVGLQSELSIKRIYADSAEYTTTIEYYRSKGFELSAFVPNNLGHFPRLIETDCIMYNAATLAAA